ncbi:potassium channel family protein [Brevibacillus sp. B_LB10_24]|uniref:potassium channel family protein n=1 Tax=Brevibacillus sp. B_LB10_24 TaxID=3380645 RepID=UPI0038BA4410
MISFLLTVRRLAQGLWHAFKDKNFQAIFIITLFILLSGTLFYHSEEGLSFIDALYFSVTTLTTVGSSGFVPSTTLGKIFTILYIFAGAGLTFGVVTRIAYGIFSNKNKEDEKQGGDEKQAE